MFSSFGPAVPERHGRRMPLFSIFTAFRTEHAAHQQLLAAASAFVEEPNVQRLERLQAAVRYSQQNGHA